MGFYSPATIVDDGKRRGVVFLPVDVRESGWDCAMAGKNRVRMGLRYVKGLSEKSDGDRIAAARNAAPFASMEDFSKRAGVGEKALAALASAGAFDGLEPTRRSSLWKARGLRKEDPDVFLSVPEGEVSFDQLHEFERISWDYEASSHSTHGHPLGPLRGALRAQGLPDARTVARMANGRRARYAGLVICRQRPGTASGVTFMTLEDETGFVNLVIWSQKFSEYALLIKTTAFLGATGKVQAESGVVHIVVDELWKPKLTLEPSKVRSRDFH
jgi:error-prone DNA polymerase